MTKNSQKERLDLLLFKMRGKSVDQLFSLFAVRKDKSVKVLGRSDLELGVVSVALDGDLLGVLLAGLFEEKLDISDLNLCTLLARCGKNN